MSMPMDMPDGSTTGVGRGPGGSRHRVTPTSLTDQRTELALSARCLRGTREAPIALTADRAILLRCPIATFWEESLSRVASTPSPVSIGTGAAAPAPRTAETTQSARWSRLRSLNTNVASAAASTTQARRHSIYDIWIPETPNWALIGVGLAASSVVARQRACADRRSSRHSCVETVALVVCP